MKEDILLFIFGAILLLLCGFIVGFRESPKMDYVKNIYGELVECNSRVDDLSKDNERLKAWIKKSK